MLTNRKKLKIRRKKLKMFFLSIIFVLATSAFLGYWIWINVLSKSHFVSPLASKVLSTDSEEQRKGVSELDSLLRESKIEFVSIDSFDTTYVIHLNNDAEVIISRSKDLNVQISSLQFIINRLTIEGRQFLRLDLRYDKPIIVFKES